LKIFYRLSDIGGRPEIQACWTTNAICLMNFLDTFPDTDITVIADNTTDKTFEWLQLIKNINIIKTSLGNCGSFNYALTLALQEEDDEIIYFVENDYLHRSLPLTSKEILLEGFTLPIDYVTLYDHLDKYEESYSKEFGFGGESTKVLLTKSIHWKLVSSTCMTFASKVKTLREDESVLRIYTQKNIPEDWAMFNELKNKNRKLISPIPSMATHCVIPCLAPLIDWERIANQYG